MKEQINYLEENYNSHLNELKEFLRIKSISSNMKYHADMLECANYIYSFFNKIGLCNTQILQTDGFPLVFGEQIINNQLPTVLIYGHYDVQAPGKASDWNTNPFEPAIKDDFLYARGASDNKGQIFMHFKVIEAYLKTEKKFPINLKIVIEGEEEIGSPNFEETYKKHRDLFRSDFVVISDTATLGLNQPSICYGLRGLLNFDIEVTGPKKDLPSGGFYGGNIQNPIHVLSKIIASFHNESGKVKVPRFYEDVEKITLKEKDSILKINFNEQELKEQIGVDKFFGEPNYSFLERVWTRPTIDINQFISGFSGENERRNIIPSLALASVSCRLVPSQNPLKLLKQIKTYIMKQYFPGVKIEFKNIEFSNPYVLDPNNPLIVKCSDALQYYFNRPVSLIRAGGSIPIVEMISKLEGIPVLLVGFGLPNGNIHGPNEHFSLNHFRQGMKALCYFWDSLSKGESL